MSKIFTFEDFTPEDIEHFGIKGQKWGIRRYQNPDGSLTPLGEQRYGKGSKGRSGKKAKDKIVNWTKRNKPKIEKNIKKGYTVTLATIGGVVSLATAYTTLSKSINAATRSRLNKVPLDEIIKNQHKYSNEDIKYASERAQNLANILKNAKILSEQ